MGIDVGTLTDKMIDAGKGLAGGIWAEMQTYAIPELKKIAIQIEALAEPDNGFKPEAIKLLFQMQVNAAVSVIVAMTALTMQLVQEAINAILDAVRDLVNGAVGIALI